MKNGFVGATFLTSNQSIVTKKPFNFELLDKRVPGTSLLPVCELRLWSGMILPLHETAAATCLRMYFSFLGKQRGHFLTSRCPTSESVKSFVHAPKLHSLNHLLCPGIQPGIHSLQSILVSSSPARSQWQPAHPCISSFFFTAHIPNCITIIMPFQYL